MKREEKGEKGEEEEEKIMYAIITEEKFYLGLGDETGRNKNK